MNDEYEYSVEMLSVRSKVSDNKSINCLNAISQVLEHYYPQDLECKTDIVEALQVMAKNSQLWADDKKQIL